MQELGEEKRSPLFVGVQVLGTATLGRKSSKFQPTRHVCRRTFGGILASLRKVSVALELHTFACGTHGVGSQKRGLEAPLRATCRCV